ncbi:MAG TPA: helicase-associated domain-containing protein [Mycobacteriales bacterium]
MASGPPATRRPRSGARSLADWLRSWTDAELAALVVARPDLVVPVPNDVGVLATRAADRVHATRALDGLDRFCLHVLDALLLLDQPVAPGRVRDLVGADVSDALRRLEDLALVWDAPELRVVAGVVAAVPRPAGLGRPAVQLLRRTDRQVLAGMLAAHDLPGTADTDEATARLVRALAVPEDAAELRVLEAVDAGGAVGHVADAMRPSDPQDPSPVRRLVARGLLIPVDTETVELPREIGAALRPRLLPDVPVQPPPYEPAAGGRDPDADGALAAAESVRLTAALLAHWGDQPPAERKSGGVGARELRAAARELGVPEQTTALLAEIAHAAGLLGRTTALDPAFAPTADADAWERLELPQRWHRLARAWLSTPTVTAEVGSRDERDAVVTALAQQSYRPAARELRGALLAEMAGGPGTPASVLARLAWRTPRRIATYEPLIAPTLAEAAFLGVVVGDTVTSFGGALLAGGGGAELAAALPAPVDHVLLQADHTAVAPGRLPNDLARDMALVADVESPGSATVYRFTAATLRRALDAGWTGSDVHEFLTRIAKGAVPQGLSYLVDDAARRHGLLRAGTATSYLRCDDETLLAEVLTDPRCQGLRLRRIAPTVLVSALGAGALVDGLRAAGYAPVGERPDGGVEVIGRQPVRASRSVAAAYPEQRADEKAAARIVASLRAGDTASRVATRERGGVTTTMALLESAASGGSAVVLGYVNAQGQTSRRIVEPRRVAGGLLTAYDHRSQEDRSFALHRITEVQVLDPGDTVA